MAMPSSASPQRDLRVEQVDHRSDLILHPGRVPGALLPLVILTEVAGALAIVAGWRTRTVALLVAGFCLLTAIAFHRNFADQNQMINLLKNVSIAGEFLLLVADGPGPLSIDGRLRNRP